MKRIIRLLVVLSIVLNTVPVIHANAYTDTDNTKYEKAAGFLNGLGLIEGFDDGSYEVGEPMTRAELAELTVKMSGVETLKTNDVYFKDVTSKNPNKAAIDTAYLNGYILGRGQYFHSTAAVDCETLARAFVSVLGYSSVTTDFMRQATNLGIFKNTEIDANEVTRGEALIAAYNTLFTEMMEMSGTSFERGGTLLEERFKVYESTGYVTAVGSVDMVNGINSYEDCIKIDNVLYSLQGVAIDESMLSKRVGFYYKEIDGDMPELIYCYEKDGNDVYSATDEFIIPEECTTTRFAYYDRGREKKVKIPVSAKFMLNGYIIPDENKLDDIFDINAGYVEIVLPANGGTPLVRIWNYKYLYVENPGSDTLFLRGDRELDVDENSAHMEVRVYNATGAEASVKDILPDSGIAVADVTPVDGILRRNIYILSSVSGVCNGIGPDTINIDGVRYRKIGFNSKDIRMGFRYTFFIGMEGEICLVDTDNADSASYGMLLTIYRDEIENDALLSMRILNTSGEEEYFEFADKLYINDVGVRRTEISTDNGNWTHIYNIEANRARRQPIGYMLNESGKVSRIWYAEEDSDVLSLDSDYQSLTCKSGAIFNFGGKVAVKDSGVIYMVPKDMDTASNDDFVICTSDTFTNDTSYTVAGYNMNDLLEADILCVQIANTDIASYNDGNTYACVFDKKIETVNGDGDITYEITYWQQGVKYKKNVDVREGRQSYADTVETVKGMNRGDIFKVEYTADNSEIKNISVEFAAENRAQSSNTAYNDQRLMYYGRVTAVGPTSIVIQGYDGTRSNFLSSSKYLFKNAARVNTYLYEGKSKEIQLLQNCLADVRVGDWAVYQARNAAARTLVIYRDPTRLPNGQLDE